MKWFWMFIVIGIATGVLSGIVQASVRSRANKNFKSKSMSIMIARGYKVTKEIDKLLIDEVNKKWTVSGYTDVFDYTDIISISETKNGIKSLSAWSINVTVNKPANPLVQIVLYANSSPIQVGGFTYNSINLLREKYIAQLEYMKNQVSVPLVQPQSQSTSTDTIYTKVVGVTKLNDKGISIQSILPDLSEDSDLYLRREPDNQYDSNAVKIFADHQHIGYIKATVAQQIAPLMDSGQIIEVELLEVTGGGEKNYGCNIRLDIPDGL